MINKSWSHYYGLIILAVWLGVCAVKPFGTVTSDFSPSLRNFDKIDAETLSPSNNETNFAEQEFFILNETPFSPTGGNSSFSNLTVRFLTRSLGRADFHSIFPFLNRFGIRHFSRSCDKNVIYWEKSVSVPLYLIHRVFLI